jgi:hypothetical protein
MDQIRYKTFRDSSVLKSAAWDEKTETLLVVFNSNSVWNYQSVPYDVFLNLINSNSAGKFFNLNIRNSYVSTCVYKKTSENV